MLSICIFDGNCPLASWGKTVEVRNYSYAFREKYSPVSSGKESNFMFVFSARGVDDALNQVPSKDDLFKRIGGC